jgi:HEAT repeat protein
MRLIDSLLTPPTRLLGAACFAAVTFLAVAAAPLAAQPADDAAMEEDPFEAAADEAPPADEPPEKDPFAVEGEPPPAAKPEPAPPADEGEPAESESVPDSPAVEAVLESNPQTPFELLRAVRILADLGYPKLAQPYVDQLNKQQLDPQAKAALVNRFDSAQLMRLAGNPALAEKLAPFIDDLFRSAEAFRRDPARLSQWAGQLSDPDEAVRARAIVALLRARESAVAPLVAILADPARASEHAAAKRMLVRLDDAAIGPLLGALESPDAALRTQAIEVLGALRAREAVADLLAAHLSPAGTPQLRAAAARAIENTSGRVPDAGEALRLLRHAATRSLEQSRDERGDGPPLATVWHWNSQQYQSVPVVYDRTGQVLVGAVRLAYQLAQLDPQNADDRRLYLTALLQLAKLGGGLDKPLASGPGTAYAIAAASGADAIEQVLIHAMAEGYIPAATAAAQILGDIATPDVLARGGPAASALARAANHADRRLRFAATEAILKLNPSEPFAGSSHVTEGLGFFAGSYGSPRILIAHPLSAEGAKLAGLAAGLGYEADIATNGRQAYELAVASPDYELVFIHSAIARPAVDELVAQLRRDRRTATLPLGLIAPLNNLERVEDFARRTGRAEAFLQPQDEEEMKLLVGDVLAHAGRSHVASAERKAEALAALDGLVALAQSPNRVFDVRSLEGNILPLVYVPELAGRAIELLGDVGTDKAQRALVELADSPAASLATRKAAVAALARSVRAGGILLTTDEIRREYDLYNTNAASNAETHEVLGAVLDVIEHKGAPPAE